MPDCLVHPRQNITVHRRAVATNKSCYSAHFMKQTLRKALQAPGSLRLTILTRIAFAIHL
jgi:hypothetical protein